MNGGLYLAFLAVSTAVIVIPGPSIMLIVANALRDGTRAGFFTVGGTSVAMAIQLAIAIAALSSLVTQLAAGLALIRWAGVACLVYLGVRSLRDAARENTVPGPQGSPGGSAFGEGFVVSLTNPTTMVFFVAFFPQFLTGAAPALAELALLGASFWGLALAFDCAYAGLASSIGRAMREPRWAAARHRAAGIILLIAALLLALARIRNTAIP